MQEYLTVGESRINSAPLYTMANSLWINDKFNIYSDFVSETSKAFDAPVQVVDFNSRQFALSSFIFLLVHLNLHIRAYIRIFSLLLSPSIPSLLLYSLEQSPK